MFNLCLARLKSPTQSVKPGFEAERAHSPKVSSSKKRAKRQKRVIKPLLVGVNIAAAFVVGCSPPQTQPIGQASNPTASNVPLTTPATQVITSTPAPSQSVAPATSSDLTGSSTITSGSGSVGFSPNSAPTSDLPTSPVPTVTTDQATNDKNQSMWDQDSSPTPDSNVDGFVSTNPTPGTEDVKPGSDVQNFRGGETDSKADFGSENGGIFVKLEDKENKLEDEGNKNDFTIQNEVGQTFTVKTTNTTTGLIQENNFSRPQIFAGAQLTRPVGNYTMQVTSLNSQGNVLGTDIKTVNVLLGQNTTVTFSLSYFRTETKAPIQLSATLGTVGVPISISEQGKNTINATASAQVTEQSSAGTKIRWTLNFTGSVHQMDFRPDTGSGVSTFNVNDQSTYSFDHLYAPGKTFASAEITLRSAQVGEVTIIPITLNIPSTNTPSSPPPSSPPPGDVKPGGDQPPQTGFSNISWSTVSANLLLQDGFQSTINNGMINIYSVFSGASAMALSPATFQTSAVSSIPGNGAGDTFAAHVNGKDYIGGRNGSSGGTSSPLYIYNATTNTHGTTTPWPHNGFFRVPAAVVDNDHIILAGGASDPNLTPTNAVRRFNTVTGVWDTLPNLLRPRYAPAAALGADGKLYVFGGFGESSLEHSAEVLDLRNTSGGWTYLTTPATRRRLAKAVAIPGTSKIAIIGGMNDNSALSSIDIFDTVARSYTPGNPLAMARYNHGAHYVNGKLIVFGGSNNTGRIGQIEVGTLQ